MNDILDEVLNDERDEKRLNLFRKILPAIIIITLFIAILMTGYNWYNAKLAEHNKELGDLLIDAAPNDSGKEPTTINILEQIIKSGENHQSELAQVQLIHYTIGKNDVNQALKLLESTIANKNYRDITTSYARLLWLSLVLDEEVLSEIRKTQARNHLDHFSKENQLFFANAMILKSLFCKKIKQPEEAALYANSVLNLETASILLKEQALAILSSLKNNK